MLPHSLICETLRDWESRLTRRSRLITIALMCFRVEAKRKKKKPPRRVIVTEDVAFTRSLRTCEVVGSFKAVRWSRAPVLLELPLVDQSVIAIRHNRIRCVIGRYRSLASKCRLSSESARLGLVIVDALTG